MIQIGRRKIGTGHPVYLIAEAGINHNGREALALELVRAAALAGADAVKFQIVTADRSYTKKSESYPIFKKIELDAGEWKNIFDFARECNISCFATFTNSEDLNDFAFLNCPAFKISSSNLTHLPLLRAVARLGRPVILSTGLSFLEEVQEALHCLEDGGCRQIAILQCTSLYPSPPSRMNLNTMKTLAENFPRSPVGFSDHSVGTACAIAAAAMGASLIEKHFTLDKKLPGPDHFFSANPQELKALVQAVREVEEALGSSAKEPVPEEIPLRERWQRSLVALKDIKAGERLTADKVGIKRSPKKGLEPKYFESVLEKEVQCALAQDDPITLEILSP